MNSDDRKRFASALRQLVHGTVLFAQQLERHLSDPKLSQALRKYEAACYSLLEAAEKAGEPS